MFTVLNKVSVFQVYMFYCIKYKLKSSDNASGVGYMSYNFNCLHGFHCSKKILLAQIGSFCLNTQRFPEKGTGILLITLWPLYVTLAGHGSSPVSILTIVC